ncbi:MAG: hypothetical protein KJ066_21165 [Acidobacteria bacterium]|nr:hypothetical protein [Acidobacteriota bacterium]
MRLETGRTVTPGDADAQLRADRARHEVAVWRACSDVYGDESLVMPAY